MQQNTVIAIDGYSSCGKSTLAKQLAQKLQFGYIDSGAMYRAMTLHLLRNQIELKHSSELETCLSTAKITFKSISGENNVYLNDEDVSFQIREMHVSDKVSKVSPLQIVRRELVKLQQDMGKTCSIIMDGRDIGTHVFPNAHVKFFMTADPQVRAHRRYSELKSQNSDVTFEQIVENLRLRDHDDTTRKESPLRCAADAIIIDNTHITMEHQLDKALEIVSARINC